MPYVSLLLKKQKIDINRLVKIPLNECFSYVRIYCIFIVCILDLDSKVEWNLRLPLKYLSHIHQFSPKFKANLRFYHRLYRLMFSIFKEKNKNLYKISFKMVYNMPIWLINSNFSIFWSKFGHFPEFCPANRETCNNQFFFCSFFVLMMYSS